MAPSLAPPMTPNPGVIPSKRPSRMVPILPAIPRSLEKKKYKNEMKGSNNRAANGSPICSIYSNGKEESQEEAAITQTQAAENKVLTGSDTRDDVQENGLQDAIVKSNDGSDKKVATTEVDGSNASPVHAQDFGLEKHGFRLPPPFYPKRSPPPAISTDFSSANGKASASEATQAVEEEYGSNVSQQSSAKNHVSLNAAAPSFHAHPNPPADVTASPKQSPYNGYGLAESVPPQLESIPPTDAVASPTNQPYQGYDATTNISFYAPPISSNDPPSPNHSIYQGYAYAPTPHGYSPQSRASQHPVDSPHRTEAGAPYVQLYESQAPSYSNQSPYPILGSQPPLTPSRTPLDPSAQPWSYSNGPPPTIPFDYGYMPSYDPPTTLHLRDRSTSRRTPKLEESARKADVVDDRFNTDSFNAYEMKAAQLFKNCWVRLNDFMSNHVPLVEHLLQQFNVEEYADCQLTLVHENLRFEKTTWSVSSLLLAQSRKLRDLLKSAGLSEDGKRRLEIRLADRFVTPWAMNSALRVIYGERPEMFTLAIIHNTFDANAESWTFRMDECLAFAAAGHVLGLDNITLHGLGIASSILLWENLEQALSFGLESGPNRGNSPSADVIPSCSYSPVWSRHSDPPFALNLTPPSSSTESRPERPGHAGSGFEGISSESSNVAEVRSAGDLQRRCLQWMASHLDDYWQFDPSARPLAEVDRLPATAESRSPLSRSRLSRIQFGDHPSELNAKASDRNVLVSSIVLSIPFMALKYLLDVGAQPIMRQLHAIVNERERRRQIVLQSKSVPWSQRLAAKDHEWAEVGYIEQAETTADGKVTVARTFTGIDRQVSEPSTPNQQKRQH